MGRYLDNQDGTCAYEDMDNQADIGAYKVPAKDNIVRENKEAIREPLNNFGPNTRGEWKWFPENESEFRKRGESEISMNDKLDLQRPNGLF